MINIRILKKHFGGSVSHWRMFHDKQLHQNAGG